MSGQNRQGLSYSTLLLIGIAWIGLEYFVLGPYSAVTTGDNADVIIPDLMSFGFTGDGFALWNRFSLAGTDRLAAGSLTPFDIWLFNTLPNWLTYPLRVLSQIAFAAIAIFIITRKWLGMAASGALIAGLSYALIVGASGRLYMAVLSYLPLLVLTIGLVLDNHRSLQRWLMLFLATGLFSTTAHMGYLFPFPQALIGVWFLVVDQRTKVIDWLIIIAAPMLAVVARLPNYLAMAAEAPLSQRHVTGETYDVDALSRAFFAGKNIFVGSPEKVIVTILALVACVHLWRLRVIRRLIFASALIAATVIGVGAVHAPLFELFPFAKGFNVNRLWSVLPFLAVMLAGYGVQALAASGGDSPKIFKWPRDRVFLSLALAVLFLSSLHYKIGSAKDWVSQGNMVQNFSSPQLRALADRIRSEPLPVRVGAYRLYPNYLHAYGMETPGGYVSMTPRRYYDFWRGVLEPSLRPGDTQGIARMFIQNGNRLMLSADNQNTAPTLADYFNLNLLSLANVKYFVSRDPLGDQGLVLVDGGDHAWSALSTTEKILASTRANFVGREGLYIYRNPEALERFFIAPQVRIFDDPKILLDSLSDATTGELATTAFVLRDDLPETMSNHENAYSTGTVSSLLYDSDRIDLAIDAFGPALLVITNSYNAKWNAQVDGIPTSIFPVDNAFMGLMLPIGTKRVTLLYARERF